MLLNSLLSGGIRGVLVTLLLTLPAVILCLSIHETCHGLAAYALGDHTAANQGRLTLDPMAHIDPAGFICMLLLGFGWAKPVPVNISNFKNRRAGAAIVAAAGPLSNFIVGLLGYLLYFAISYATADAPGKLGIFAWVVALFFRYLAMLSVGLGTFNLLPVYPLDGSRMLDAFLPFRLQLKLQQYQTYLLFGLIFLMWFGGTDILIGTVNSWIAGASYRLFTLFV
ncbi:MAG: site-2 protease family protein [Clostridiaceae bacterium]|nr:site-2 protease family protein [Clostridiaceae bacterium]MCI9484619.1 site-2 protease family protein [Clostridiaceae bacterium]NBH80207.1 site-2 protease family protein [Clostridiaceae bacterium]NBI82914.1 site-2 protease family protein [Clostridiaceae bacterium]